MSKRLQMLEQMLAKGSTDPFHHYARAMELRSLGRLQDALIAFSTVRDSFADYVPTYLMAGQLAIELGDEPNARQWLTTGIAKAQSTGNDHALSELQSALKTLES
jgi:hypothetical protein